jgi:hypothetical protein
VVAGRSRRFGRRTGFFAAYQLRRKRSGATPLVELSVLARRSYACGVVFVIVFFGALAGFTLAVGCFSSSAWATARWEPA